MSFISIIVPVYNTEHYLNRCITSIISQTFRDIEILLINDGSTDNSLNILSHYAKNDKRIKVINQENRGLSATRNRGIKTADSPYILHVDSDDWIEADMCEVMYTEAVKNNADIVTSDIYIDRNNKTQIKREPYPNVCCFKNFLEIFAIKGGLTSVWNKLIKRDLYILNKIEHYEDIAMGEDSTTLLRLAVFANTIITVAKPFYHYNKNSMSMTASKNKKVMDYIYGLSRVETFYQEKSIDTDLFPLLRYKTAYKALIECSFNRAKQLNNSDYYLLYGKFYNEIDLIIKHPLFYELRLTDKCYIIVSKILSIIYNHITKGSK